MEYPLDSDTIVRICVDGDQSGNDAHYFFDAVRWVKLLEIRGIPHQNIHIHGSALNGITKDFLKNTMPEGFTFGMSVSELERVWRTYYRSGEDIFADRFTDPSIRRQMLIFLNYGGRSAIGKGDINLSSDRLSANLNDLAIPTLVISTTCFARNILEKISPFAANNQNLVWVYDAGTLDFHITSNWGFVDETNTHYYAGKIGGYHHDISNLCVHVELNTRLLPDAESEFLCRIRIFGNATLLRHPFFGTLPVCGKMGLPHWGDEHMMALPSPTVEETEKPFIKDALLQLYERTLVSPAKERTFYLANSLVERALTNQYAHGAFVCDAIMWYGLDDDFGKLLETVPEMTPTENQSTSNLFSKAVFILPILLFAIYLLKNR